jgi:5-methyltetrahydrofolate--homocysteine methyltransferase
MAIPGLTIIGESINDSVPSTKKLYDANDIAGLKALAQSQDQGGATYIDVNVGSRSPEFMAEMVRQVQGVTTKPLSIDSPDPAMVEAGLRAYDLARAGGKPPVLNSISLLRTEMLDFYGKIQKFRPILLVSERKEDGRGMPNHTGQQVYESARELFAMAREHGIPAGDCIIDPAIAPIGSDSEGHLRRIVEAMTFIHQDTRLQGVHMSVGLSNFTVMLPPKRPDGSPTKGPLESAFLTLAMPLGLDYVIGSVKRNYEKLGNDHPAMRCLNDCLKLEGFDVLSRVQEFYSN